MNIPFKQTPNYTPNQGNKKIGFVLHGTLGAFNGAVEWLMTPPEKRPDGSSSSAHYVIGRKDGEVIQLVKNEDVSWHAGFISNPSERAKKAMPKKTDGTFMNPNQSFIGIEFAWGYDTDNDGDVDANDKTLTEWQWKTAIEIIKASGVPFNPDLILSHQEIASYKGDNMLFAVNEINKRMAVPETPPAPATNVKEEIAKKFDEIAVLVRKL